MPGYSASGVNGSGWVISQLPYLHRTAPKNGDADATIVVITNGVDARYFDHTGSTYTERMGGQDTLVHNTGNDTFALTDSMGDVFTFNDFNGSLPVNQKGQFQSFTDPAGNVGQVISRTSDGKPTEFQRSTTSGGVTTTESYVYAYVISGVNAGLLSNVTLRQQVNGGSWSTVRQVAYAYYDGTTSFGNAGDLMTATVEDGSNTVLDTDYYRYYTSNSSTGYVHGLKYSFTGHSYDRLFAALGNNYTTASDSQVAPFADNYFEYDSLQRVTKEVAAGTGTDMNNGTGTSAITYSYSMMSVNAVDYNQWKYKTTETFADGCRQTVYANGYGETMLTVFADSRTNITYLTFHKYDNAGRLIMTAMPSAVTGYGEQYPDLLDNTGGSSYQYIATLSGLLEFTDYYTSTTATATTSGGVLGYVEDTAVQLGTNGPKLLVDATQYIAHSAGGATVYPMATHTLYRVGGDLTTGMTTSYAYTWFSGTTRMQSETDTNPTISSSENGPGTPDVTTTFYDTYGRPIWTKDPDGFINYTAYDPATGAVVKTITDVDTTRTGDFQNLPLNWATPTGGGLHLITQMAVNNMGRTTELIDPNGNLTYTVYKDSIDEIITYPGWQSATNTTTGPTQLTRWDQNGSYQETLTMSATPHVTNGQPDGTEAISNLQALSRTYLDEGGQAVRTDDYFNLAGLTYSTAVYIGTVGVNYYSSTTDYGALGRPLRMVDANGTITRPVYDDFGHEQQVWVGTNDTPASGTWSPTNDTSPSNMVQTTAYVFDNAVAGDNDLTAMIQYPGGGSAARETDYFYSYRDRLVATKEGVQANEDSTTHRPIMYYEYDNLGEVIAVDQYDGDGVTITTPSGGDFPSKPSASLLRAYSTTAFDDQQRLTPTSSTAWTSPRGRFLRPA